MADPPLKLWGLPQGKPTGGRQRHFGVAVVLRSDVLLEVMNMNVADLALGAVGQPQTYRVRVMLVRALRRSLSLSK